MYPWLGSLDDSLFSSDPPAPSRALRVTFQDDHDRCAPPVSHNGQSSRNGAPAMPQGIEKGKGKGSPPHEKGKTNPNCDRPDKFARHKGMKPDQPLNSNPGIKAKDLRKLAIADLRK